MKSITLFITGGLYCVFEEEDRGGTWSRRGSELAENFNWLTFHHSGTKTDAAIVYVRNKRSACFATPARNRCLTVRVAEIVKRDPTRITRDRHVPPITPQ